MLYALLFRPVFVFMTIIFNWINIILSQRIDIIREHDKTIRRTSDSSNRSNWTGGGSMIVVVVVVFSSSSDGGSSSI